MASICEKDQATQGSVETRRMWANGPFRQWSEARVSRWIPYTTGGYVGAYVCEKCTQTCSGVYKVKMPTNNTVEMWLCGTCRTAVKPTKRHLATHVEHAPLSAVCM